MLLDEGYESVAASVRFLGLMLLAVPINVVLLCLVWVLKPAVSSNVPVLIALNIFMSCA